MGAWGTGIFDNDTACDWAYELEESSDLSVIERSVNAVFDEDYIDADFGCEALAAIDTIARLKGNNGVNDAYAENVDKWVKDHPIVVPPELVEKAKKATLLILGEESELAELWSDSESFDSWKSEVESLLERVSA